ncbi:MAG TPA: ABC transporter permease [Silvibacterium sp.]|nr:ABC transporter permease [Silvibacterium sp.]
MNTIARFFRKVGFLIRREKFNVDLAEEMRFHREQQESEFQVEGMTREDAGHAARRRFGNATRAHEQSREVVGFRAESVVQDLRFALRQLRKNPGFTATAILVLALGICASVAIFAFVDAALIQPLPYQNPSRLVVLFESITVGPRFHLSYFDYLDWKKLNRSFSALDLYSSDNFILRTPTGKQEADGASVTADFFRTLGVTPVLGRDFQTDRDSPSAPRAVLLSYSAWQKRYGGGRNVIGQVVTIDDVPHTIIGVLPRDFHFAPAEPADFWAAIDSSGNCEKNRDCHNFFGVARLKDGASPLSAFADIRRIAQQLQKQYPDSNRNRGALLAPLADVIFGDIRPILLVLLSGAALLLLIAAVNVASLLLARSESRRREMAVRGALGASRARLIRQFVTEGLSLVAVACLLGVGAAYVAMRLIAGLIPRDMMAGMPYLRGLGLNGHVLVFACAISLITGALLSITPALRLPLRDLHAGLGEGGRGSASMMWRRFGANLVVVELAMAVVLLVGAGLLGKSFYRLLHVNTGIEPERLASVQVDASGNAYAKDPQQIALGRQVAARVASLPGVQSAAISSTLPLGDGDGIKVFSIGGRPQLGETYESIYREVSSGYFSTLRTQLLRGRYFTEQEDASRPPVAIINQSLAAKFFPNQNAVGRRISVNGTAREIIGVIDDIQEGQLDAAPRAAMYVPFNQDPNNDFVVIVRTSQDEASVLPALTASIHEIDRGLATYNAVTMHERIHDSPTAYLHRAAAWLVGGFAGLALILGVVGLYGVIAYSVSQRTREIGVRMALGAQRSSVYQLILREAGLLTALGVSAGLVCAIAAATFMGKLLFGVRSWDLPTLIGVALLLSVSALVASFIPARRAASVNPVEALRAE